jgi:hypothetical protein
LADSHIELRLTDQIAWSIAIVYVMIEVADGIDESAIIANPIMVGDMAEQAQLLADEMFKSKNPDAVITHEALALTVN